MNVVVNGGTGWLGIATIRALKKFENLGKLEIFSSDGRKFQAHDLGEFSSKPLSYLNQVDFNVDVFVNLAFKTRDYISVLGEEEYTKSNLEIISKSLSLARSLKPKSIVLVSSGVVARNMASGGKLDKTEYTRLKIIEEDSFAQLAEEVGSNLVILRMWGGTGRDLISPFKYAIGDLIKQALLYKYVDIESNYLVFRRYSDASQQIEIALNCALNGTNMIFDSGGEIIEIGELANRIVEVVKMPTMIRRGKLVNDFKDEYFSTSDKFETMALNFGIKLFDLEEQIEETLLSVKRAL